MNTDTILCGDALTTLRTLPSESVHCVVTSPPYFGLRDYGRPEQIGQEETPTAYVARLVAVFAEVRRVLRTDGTCWLNLGDSYANDDKWGGATGGRHAKGLHGPSAVGRIRRHTGLKPKDLMLMPARVALALQEDGWWVRAEIIWAKSNPMPESVTDRPTRAHEMVYLLTKSERYHYDADAIREPLARPDEVTRANPARFGGAQKHAQTPTRLASGNPYNRAPNGGRNKRDVWRVSSHPYPGAHFATMPPKLVEPCILAGCPAGGVVLDPFMGSGTVGLVARRHNRRYLGIELNPEYITLAQRRIAGERQPVLWSIA